MNSKSRGLTYLVVCCLIQVFTTLYTADFLPDRVGTRFGIENQPVGWMSKKGHIAFSLCLAIFLNFVFFGISVVIEKVNTLKYFNIPGKTYWTSTPELEKQGVQKLIQTMVLGGFGLNIILLLTQLLILSKNTEQQTLSIDVNQFMFVVLTLATVYIVWILRLFRKQN